MSTLASSVAVCWVNDALISAAPGNRRRHRGRADHHPVQDDRELVLGAAGREPGGHLGRRAAAPGWSNCRVPRSSRPAPAGCRRLGLGDPVAGITPGPNRNFCADCSSQANKGWSATSGNGSPHWRSGSRPGPAVGSQASTARWSGGSALRRSGVGSGAGAVGNPGGAGGPMPWASAAGDGTRSGQAAGLAEPPGPPTTRRRGGGGSRGNALRAL